MKSIQHQVRTGAGYYGKRIFPIQALAFSAATEGSQAYILGQSEKGKELAVAFSADQPSVLGFFIAVLEMYGYKVTPPGGEQ